MPEEKEAPSHVLVPTSTINIQMPVSELVETKAKGILAHPTETRGKEAIPIVVETKEWSCLDPHVKKGKDGEPDEIVQPYAFKVGNKLWTMDDLLPGESGGPEPKSDAEE